MVKTIVIIVSLGTSPLVAQQNYNRQIEEQKGRIESLSKQETFLHRDLFETQKRSEKLIQEISALEIEKKTLANNMSQNDALLNVINQNLGDLEDEMYFRIRSLWLHKRPNIFQTLFSSNSSSDFQYKKWLLRLWLKKEGEMLGFYREQTNDLKTKEATLKRDRLRLSTLLKNLENKKRALHKEQTERKKLLLLVKSQKNFYRQSIAELEDARANLDKLITSLKAGNKADSRFKQMYGKLSMPLIGRLERAYGPYIDKRLKTKVYHKGIDLRASQGTPVRSVFDGKIVYADWFVGYGKIVIVDHDGEYFTLYAHLSEILKNVGDYVVVGEPIAKVGDTGSIKGAYLYFEVRRKGISENPMPWFSGHMRRP